MTQTLLLPSSTPTIPGVVCGGVLTGGHCRVRYEGTQVGTEPQPGSLGMGNVKATSPSQLSVAAVVHMSSKSSMAVERARCEGAQPVKPCRRSGERRCGEEEEEQRGEGEAKHLLSEEQRCFGLTVSPHVSKL